MISGIPSSHLHTSKERPERGMGPEKVQNHRGRHPIDYVGLGTRLKDSYEQNRDGAP
jgi:hypothetical protein